MSDEGRPNGLNYEINLECDACGHAQFLHCDAHPDPCGCLASYSREMSVPGATGRVVRNCACTEFVRPASALPADPDFWRNHCEEETA